MSVDKADILRATNIADVVGERVALRRNGNGFVGLCPFHQEKTASFRVNVDRQTFKCFGCGQGGDVITFVQLSEGLQFVDALQALATRAGLGDVQGNPEEARRRDELRRVCAWAAHVFECYYSRAEGADARSYMRKRGYCSQTTDAFGVGFALNSWGELMRLAEAKKIPLDLLQAAGLIRSKEGQRYDCFRDRIMFPISTASGSVVGFGGRAMTDSAYAKYLNSPEHPVFQKSKLLFGLAQAKQEILSRREAIVVEGYMDVLAAHQAGFPHAVAVMGTALTKSHIESLTRLADRILIVLDGDTAGFLTASKSCDIAIASGATNTGIVCLPGGNDPADVLMNGGSGKFAEALESARSPIDYQSAYLRWCGRTPTQVANRLAEMIAQHSDPIWREKAAREAAEKSGVTFGAMQTAMSRAGAGKKPASQRAASATSNGLPMARRVVLGAMLHDKNGDLRRRLSGREEVFGKGPEREIAEAIVAGYAKSQQLEILGVIGALSEEATAVLAEISASEELESPSDDALAASVEALSSVERDFEVERAIRETTEAVQQGDTNLAQKRLSALRDKLLERHRGEQ